MVTVRTLRFFIGDILQPNIQNENKSLNYRYRHEAYSGSFSGNTSQPECEPLSKAMMMEQWN